jgi:hypothetical protein
MQTASKIATVARYLPHWWDEPIVDSIDVADCLEALLCDVDAEDDVKLLERCQTFSGDRRTHTGSSRMDHCQRSTISAVAVIAGESTG